MEKGKKSWWLEGEREQGSVEKKEKSRIEKTEEIKDEWNERKKRAGLGDEIRKNKESADNFILRKRLKKKSEKVLAVKEAKTKQILQSLEGEKTAEEVQWNNNKKEKLKLILDGILLESN